MVSQLAGCVHRWDGSRGERLALPVATTEDGLLRCDYDLVRSVVRQDDVAREEDRGTVIEACTVSKRNRASAKRAKPESLSALVLACLSVLSRKLSDMARMRHAACLQSLQQRVLSLLVLMIYYGPTIVHVTCAV